MIMVSWLSSLGACSAAADRHLCAAVCAMDVASVTPRMDRDEPFFQLGCAFWQSGHRSAGSVPTFFAFRHDLCARFGCAPLP